MFIIGITGTIGAGKGTIVDYITSNFDFQHLSVRQFLIDKLSAENRAINRDTMVEMANSLREKYSPSYIIDCLYEQALKSKKNTIIESIRTPGEVYSLKEKAQFLLFSVDANPKIRYDRIVLRNSETDHIAYEVFLENENREMNSDNPNHQNLKKCIELSDYKFNNDGSIEDLHQKVKEVLLEIKI